MIPQARPEHETATEGLASREPGNEVTEAVYVYTLEDTTNSKEEHRRAQKHQTIIHEMHRGGGGGGGGHNGWSKHPWERGYQTPV